jgi:hypothetical protein
VGRFVSLLRDSTDSDALHKLPAESAVYDVMDSNALAAQLALSQMLPMWNLKDARFFSFGLSALPSNSETESSEKIIVARHECLKNVLIFALFVPEQKKIPLCEARILSMHARRSRTCQWQSPLKPRRPNSFDCS